jgi:hypothetical protein
MNQGKSAGTMINENVLSEFDEWGQTLAVQGLTTDFWIRAIYGSYLYDTTD